MTCRATPQTPRVGFFQAMISASSPASVVDAFQLSDVPGGGAKLLVRASYITVGLAWKPGPVIQIFAGRAASPTWSLASWPNYDGGIKLRLPDNSSGIVAVKFVYPVGVGDTPDVLLSIEAVVIDE